MNRIEPDTAPAVPERAQPPSLRTSGNVWRASGKRWRPPSLSRRLSLGALVLFFLVGIIVGSMVYVAAEGLLVSLTRSHLHSRAAAIAAHIASSHEREAANFSNILYEPFTDILAQSSILPANARRIEEIFAKHMREHPAISAIALTDAAGTVLVNREFRQSGLENLDFLASLEPPLPHTVVTRNVIINRRSLMVLIGPVYTGKTTLGGYVVAGIDPAVAFAESMAIFSTRSSHPDTRTCTDECHIDNDLLTKGFPAIATENGALIHAPASIDPVVASSFIQSAIDGNGTVHAETGILDTVSAVIPTGADTIRLILFSPRNAGLGLLDGVWTTAVATAFLVALLFGVLHVFMADRALRPLNDLVRHARNRLGGVPTDSVQASGIRELDELADMLDLLGARATAHYAFPGIDVDAYVDTLLQSVEVTTERALAVAESLHAITRFVSDGSGDCTSDASAMADTMEHLRGQIAGTKAHAEETALITARLADSPALTACRSCILRLLHASDRVVEGCAALGERAEYVVHLMKGNSSNLVCGELETMRVIAESVFDTIVSTTDEVCTLSERLSQGEHAQTELPGDAVP